MNRRRRRTGALLAAGLAVAACSPEAPTVAEASLPYVFRDVTEEAGLAGFRQTNGTAEKPFIVETVGGGVALFDYDADGDLDAYLSNGSRLGGFPPGEEPRDALYANDGAGRFDDVTDAAGLGDVAWTNGVRVVDLDGDGWADLYLTNYGPNVLYRNAGDGSFRDVTDTAGVGDPSWSTGACFLDHDRDGDLDLYVANYLDFDEERMLAERPTHEYRGVTVMKGPRGLPPARDRFYRNEDGWSFRDVSEETGVSGPELFGFQCVPFDYDLDGWIDVYVANDSVANLLWHNEAGERFVDKAMTRGLAFSQAGREQAGMGVAVGDYDGDAVVDLFVTNFSDDYFTLYRGKGTGFFTDVTQRLRLAKATMEDLGWGCGFADFDSDGDDEIFAACGHVYPQVDELALGSEYRQRNKLFELADDLYAVPDGAGGPGFALKQSSRGAALGDVDGDGDLDLLIGNIDDRPTLLRNDGPNGNWIKVRLIGAGQNRDAIGARVVARRGERRTLRLVSVQDGFLSSSDPRLHFGLGAAETLDELEVTWPGGEVTTLDGLPAGHVVVIEEGDPRPRLERLGQ